MRTVASQMKDAVGQSVTIRIGGAASTGEDVVFSASGRVITFHGFLKAYVEGTDEGAQKDDAETRLPNLDEGDRVSAASVTRQRPRDQAAGALHRGDPDQGARGARDRPPVDVRLDHRHDPQPRLRLQEGHRAGPGLAGVLGDPAAGGALPAADLLRVHRPDGGRARRHRRRPARPQQRARRVLLRLRRRRGPQDAWSTSSATSTPASSRRSRSAPPRTASTCGSAATAPTSRATEDGPYAGKRANVPDDLPPDELTRQQGARAVREPRRRGDRARRAPRDRPARRGQERPLRPVRHRAAARGRAQEGPSPAPARCSSR